MKVAGEGWGLVVFLFCEVPFFRRSYSGITAQQMGKKYRRIFVCNFLVLSYFWIAQSIFVMDWRKIFSLLGSARELKSATVQRALCSLLCYRPSSAAADGSWAPGWRCSEGPVCMGPGPGKQLPSPSASALSRTGSRQHLVLCAQLQTGV